MANLRDAQTGAAGDEGDRQGPARLSFQASEGFGEWLARQRVGVVFTSKQVHKIFVCGHNDEKAVVVFERTVPGAAGVGADGRGFWAGTLYQLWRFENALEAGQASGPFDAIYLPQMAWTTGDIDIHDISTDRHGRPVFASALFSCLATTASKASFSPLWRPSFVSALAPENRCFLNGVAMADGRPRFATVAARTDSEGAWRDKMRGEGCVIDIDSGEVVAWGLTMPRSPRLVGDRLWLLNSGRTELGFLDLRRGNWEQVLTLPGYPRGLTIVDQWAVIGLSATRDTVADGGEGEAVAGIVVADLFKGEIAHRLTIDAPVREINDIALLPGVRRPGMVGFRSPEIMRQVKIGDDAEL
ncbi:MAG: TIGR03032 family protein [Alphaproteobacteria bacterium]